MANKPPAFLFYPSDFRVGVLTMDLDQIGAYVLLLCEEWDKGFLPNDHVKLAKICQTTPEIFNRVWGEIQDKFHSDGNGRLINDRMEKERSKQEQRRKVGKQFGEKGGGNPNFKKGEANPYYQDQDKGLHKGTPLSQPLPDVHKGKINFSNSNFNSKEDKHSLHTPPRVKASTPEELKNLNFVLRLHDNEFQTWMKSVTAYINEQNQARRSNPFQWKATCGNLERDLHKLIYSLDDEAKKSILMDAYNVLGQKINWPEYVFLVIKIMVCQSEKTPIKEPMKWVLSLLQKPGDVVSAKTDGPFAGVLNRGP